MTGCTEKAKQRPRHSSAARGGRVAARKMAALASMKINTMVKDAEAAKAKVRAKVSTDTHSANLALNGCVPRILAHSSAFLPR